MTGPGTNTYLLGEREIAVIDPGPDDARHLESILAAAGAPVRWVVVTHTHRDHSPLAATLARRSGAQLIGFFPPRAGGAGGTTPRRHLAAGRDARPAQRCAAHRLAAARRRAPGRTLRAPSSAGRRRAPMSGRL